MDRELCQCHGATGIKALATTCAHQPCTVLASALQTALDILRLIKECFSTCLSGRIAMSKYRQTLVSHPVCLPPNCLARDHLLRITGELSSIESRGTSHLGQRAIFCMTQWSKSSIDSNKRSRQSRAVKKTRPILSKCAKRPKQWAKVLDMD